MLSGIDFSFLGLVLPCLLLAFVVWGFFTLIAFPSFAFSQVHDTHTPLLYILTLYFFSLLVAHTLLSSCLHSRPSSQVYALVGTLIFSLYVLFDTHMITTYLTYDDYVLGAINLYLDFVNLFLMILQCLVGMRRD